MLRRDTAVIHNVSSNVHLGAQRSGDVLRVGGELAGMLAMEGAFCFASNRAVLVLDQVYDAVWMHGVPDSHVATVRSNAICRILDVKAARPDNVR